MRTMCFILALTLSAAPVQALPPDIAKLAEEGSEQLYNLDFPRAFATFERLRAAHPDHPAGYGLLASASWWQARYAFAKPDPAAATLVAENVAIAVRLAKVMSKNPDDWCEGQFFMGGALGIRAHWAMVEHSWISAALGAREAVGVLRPMITCTPYGEEAMFGLGLYEYAAARLPWSLRWLSRYVTGVGANPAGGLAKLERAATHAHWIRNDAQATLSEAYTYYDRDPVKALKYAEMFRRERPESPMALTMYVQALAISGKFDETLAAADDGLQRGRMPGSTFALETSAYDCWRGIALLGLGHTAEAVHSFTHAIEANGRAPWVTAAILKRGCAYDLLGQRALAMADYHAMLKRPDPWDQGRLAKAHLKHPFTWDDFDREIAPRRNQR